MKTIEVLLNGMDNLIQAQEFTDEEVDYMRMRIKKLAKQFGISEEEVEKMLSKKKESDETALDDYEYNYKLLQKKLSKKADPREEDDGEALPLLGLLGGLGGRMAGSLGGLGRGAVGSGGGKGGGTTIAYMPSGGSGGDGGSFGQNATAAGTSKGNVKGWLTRKHGANTAQKKKSTGLYSKSLHSWAKSKADDLQLDDSFVKKYPNNWIEMSYRIAYTMAKKRFK